MEASHRVDEIIDPITETLAEVAQEKMPTADEVAWVALRGLKESVHLGYMREHNARAIYQRYFPKYEYGD